MNLNFSPSVVVAAEAMNVMVAAGLTALPRETGGILAGFRTEDQVVVTRVAIVTDASSSSRSYQLLKHRAADELTQLQSATHPVVGFVGDWHTHPADIPPSRTDIASLELVAEAACDLVALIVVPFDTAEPRPAHALLGRKLGPTRLTRRTRVSIHRAPLTTTAITAEELERSAARCFEPERDDP